MASFVPYQIDHSVQNSAKTIGFSKKKVLFKFGFANDNSLRQGLTGPACRGSEHELLFVWSLASGKRQMFLDNKDVHYSESGQNGWTTDRAWQHAFTLRDSGGGTYRLHFVSQPVTRENPYAKPFDLRIAGISYFRFNHIYQLGTPEMIVGHQQIRSKQGGKGGSQEDMMPPEERQQMALARLESLKDMRTNDEKVRQEAPKHDAPPMKRVEESLIDFGTDFSGPPPPQQNPLPLPGAPLYNGEPQLSNSFGGYNASSMTIDSSFASSSTVPPASYYGAPVASENSAASDGFFGTGYYNNPSSSQSATSNPYYGGSNVNPYAPASASSNPYQQQQTSSDPSSMALTPYAGPGGASNPNPYIDSTGRLAMGQQMPPETPSPYGFSGQAPSFSSGSGLYGANPTSSGTVASPSNQSYGTQPSMSSQFSYGSAPSFAQPPQQQHQYSQQPPPPQQYGYNPYAPNPSYGNNYTGY